jgi:hypothetical protein
MLRPWGLGPASVVILTIGLLSPVQATENYLLVSGQAVAAIIDGNNDGPGPGDCTFVAMIDNVDNGSADVTIVSTQDTTNPLRACSGNYTATGGLFSTSAFGIVTSSTIFPPPSDVPLNYDAPYDGFTGEGTPLVSQLIVRKTEEETGPLIGRGRLCQNTTLGAEVFLRNGMRVLFDVELVTVNDNGNNNESVAALNGSQTFLKTPPLPLEQSASPFGIAMLNAYVPVRDGGIDLTTSDDSETRLLQLDFARLGPCGGVAAPTTSVWVLALLMLALTLGGAWVLGRRSTFARSLMLPGA